MSMHLQILFPPCPKGQEYRIVTAPSYQFYALHSLFSVFIAPISPIFIVDVPVSAQPFARRQRRCCCVRFFTGFPFVPSSLPVLAIKGNTPFTFCARKHGLGNALLL